MNCVKAPGRGELPYDSAATLVKQKKPSSHWTFRTQEIQERPPGKRKNADDRGVPNLLTPSHRDGKVKE